jgi:hypothetical protein
MKGAPRTRIRVETTLALTSSSTLAITLIWRTWIETLFSIDPDRHGGSLEWAIASALCVLTIAFAQLARSEWNNRPARLDAAADNHDG